ncbi:hypothetical protein Tco_1405690 [Tanacetum coccineum]
MRTKTKLTLEQTQQGVSDEVLVGIEGFGKRKVKIKGEKKEALLTLRQKPVKDEEKYEHVGSKVTSTQDGKRSQDDDKRFYLADDLKEAQNHMQDKLKGTSSSLKSKDHYAYHKLKYKDSRPRAKTEDIRRIGATRVVEGVDGDGVVASVDDVVNGEWLQRGGDRRRVAGFGVGLKSRWPEVWVAGRYDVRGTVGASLRRARSLGQVVTMCEEPWSSRYDVLEDMCHGCDDDFVSKILPQYTLHFDTADYLIISKAVSNIFIEVERVARTQLIGCTPTTRLGQVGDTCSSSDRRVSNNLPYIKDRRYFTVIATVKKNSSPTIDKASINHQRADTDEELREFTSEYYIPSALHPVVPAADASIADFPVGKVGVRQRYPISRLIAASWQLIPQFICSAPLPSSWYKRGGYSFIPSAAGRLAVPTPKNLDALRRWRRVLLGKIYVGSLELSPSMRKGLCPRDDAHTRAERMDLFSVVHLSKPKQVTEGVRPLRDGEEPLLESTAGRTMELVLEQPEIESTDVLAPTPLRSVPSVTVEPPMPDATSIGSSEDLFPQEVDVWEESSGASPTLAAKEVTETPPPNVEATSDSSAPVTHAANSPPQTGPRLRWRPLVEYAQAEAEVFEVLWPQHLAEEKMALLVKVEQERADAAEYKASCHWAVKYLEGMAHKPWFAPCCHEHFGIARGQAVLWGCREVCLGSCKAEAVFSRINCMKERQQTVPAAQVTRVIIRKAYEELLQAMER